MRTLRLANCLIRQTDTDTDDEVVIYAPKTSTCLQLSAKPLKILLALGLREKAISKNLVFKALIKEVGKKEAQEVIDGFLEYGVLVEQITAPLWDKIPLPQERTPTDVLLVVVNYPYAGDVNTPVPFGAMTIASALRNSGLEVAIVDMALKCQEAWQIVPYLRQYQPRIAGLSVITAAGAEAEKVAYWIDQWAKKESPEFKSVVLGGHHAIDFTETALNSGCYKAVVTEKLGFLVAAQVFHALLKEEVQEINGVSWFLNGKQLWGKSLGWQKDALIPVPAWDLVNRGDYSAPGANFWGMGCPFGCIYCSLGGVPKIYRPLSEVKNEFLAIMGQGWNDLALMDDEVFHNQCRTEELVKMFEQEPRFRKANLYLQSRVDSTLKRCGDGLVRRLRQTLNNLYVEIGIDGLTQKDIDYVRKGKGITTNSPFQIIDFAKELDFKVGFGSVFGFPWDTKDDLQAQSNHIRSLINYSHQQQVDLVVMSGVFTPFPGSALGRAVLNGELLGVKIVNLEPEYFDFHWPNVDTAFWEHQYLESFMAEYFWQMIGGDEDEGEKIR